MLSPEQLGISEEERDALVTLRDLLAAGKLRHHEELSRNSEDGPSFDMNTPADEGSCGTVCCIGGWVYMLMQGVALNGDGDISDENISGVDLRGAAAYVSLHGVLDDLFYPTYSGDLSYEDITPGMAVQAIGNLLNTGKPEWAAVIRAAIAE